MTDAEPLSATAPPLAGPVLASQRWSELCFLHWRVSSDQVAPLLPPGLRPDECAGSSWVGLIPFFLDRATLWGSPPVPYVGAFAEVNVRLYAVDAQGRRGVVFRSLEASRLLAVLAARASFSLPYFWARSALRVDGDQRSAESRRHVSGLAHRSRIRVGDRVDPGELDVFLTSRWGMFVRRFGRTIFVPNEHEPWELHNAELLELEDDLLASAGFPGIAGTPPDSVLWSPGITTRFGRPRRVA